MIKKFKDFFSNKKIIPVSDKHEESQEDINDKLNKSIEHDNIYDFIEAIDSGADINNVTIGGTDRYDNDYYVSPLILCIIYNRIDMFKKLIDLNVNLINVISDTDIYDYIIKIMNPSNNEKAIKYIIKKHPDFMKDVEFRKNTKKFNL